MARVGSARLRRLNRRKNLGHSDRRYGQARYLGFGWRGRRIQLTPHPLRRRQFPIYSQRTYRAYTHTTRRQARIGGIKGTRFTAQPSRRFGYLPTVPISRQLGHPIALGDDMIVVIDFRPHRTTINTIDQLFGSIVSGVGNQPQGSTVRNIILRLRNPILLYFERIRNETRERIHDVVPKFTGRLQRGMVATLNRQIRQLQARIPYFLKLNTLDNLGNPVYYANPVNNMPTEWLAHPPNEPDFRWLNGRRIPLNDPMAHENWYEDVLEYARGIARQTGYLYQAIVQEFRSFQLAGIIYQEILRTIRYN